MNWNVVLKKHFQQLKNCLEDPDLIGQVLFSLQNTNTNLSKINSCFIFIFLCKMERHCQRGKCLIISWRLQAVLLQRYFLNRPLQVHCLCYYSCSNLRPQDCISFLTGSYTSFLCHLHTAARIVYFLKQKLSLSFTWLKTFHGFLWALR